MVCGLTERKESSTFAFNTPSNELNWSEMTASFSSFHIKLELDQPSSLFSLFNKYCRASSWSVVTGSVQEVPHRHRVELWHNSKRVRSSNQASNSTHLHSKLVKCWTLGGERERVRVYIYVIHVHTRSSCASAEAHRAAHRARLLSRSLWFRRLRLLSLSSGVSLARLSRSCCLRRSSLV